jgi:hypothetical protein
MLPGAGGPGGGGSNGVLVVLAIAANDQVLLMSWETIHCSPAAGSAPLARWMSIGTRTSVPARSTQMAVRPSGVIAEIVTSLVE